MYMLSVDNFRYDVSLCLQKSPAVCFPNGICDTRALAFCHPWKTGEIACYFYDNLYPGIQIQKSPSCERG